MTKNFWFDGGDAVVHAFLRDCDSLRRSVNLSTMGNTVIDCCGDKKLDVVDVGGGHGRQAVWFARNGHNVVIVEPDARMIESAQQAISREPSSVSRRITLIEAKGEDAFKSVQRKFDAVLCHSVISYLEEPSSLFENLADLCKTDGIVSIVTPNPQSAAMRCALNRRWEDAIAAISTCSDRSPHYVMDKEWPVEVLISNLARHRLSVSERRGVGIFIDGLDSELTEDEFKFACEAEILGSITDPYRLIARCYQLICRASDE
ncbi:class I SAM-dependent methyltransferase [Pseudomonas rossensis]|uniref:class I SAM-dependent methyltransferase n=1 Tax=Pseudomonas rossensis TaxID=2305471 RepID=UPI0032611D0F